MEYLSLLYLVFHLALLIVFNVAGWKWLKPGQTAFVLSLNRPSDIRYVRGPWVHIWWPFQRLVIYSSFWVTLEIGPRTLSVGREELIDLTINTCRVIARVFDAEKAFLEAPDHDPESALIQFAVQTMTRYLSGKDLKTILADEGIAAMNDHVLQQLQEKGGEWGVRVKEFYALDVDTPEAIAKATSRKLEADAAAYETEVKSKAEVNSFRREREAQGLDWRLNQILDTARAMAENGAFRVMGDAATGLLDALLGDDQRIVTPPPRRKESKKLLTSY